MFKKISLLVIVFLVLTNLVTFFWVTWRGVMPPWGPIYEWLNPQLKLIDRPVVNKKAYENFRNGLVEKIEALEADNRVSEVAVFFRDLANGPTFGINQNDSFIPASLLKLPLAISYFTLAEEDPVVLEQQLKAEGFTLNLTQIFPADETIEDGAFYRVEDLLRRLLTYSDNRAWELLFNHLQAISPNKNLFLQAFKDLGIVDAFSETAEEVLSVKSYASIFRVLYNASYLSKEYSDKILGYLANSKFYEGLRRGVPDNIPIAHKFGERFSPTTNQLHDCGIVYYPQNPYLLCIMTKGEDFNTLSEAVGLISEAVYKEFDSRKL